jgi:ferric-dicitrate binding protein FerR (iron transport regulator)
MQGTEKDQRKPSEQTDKDLLAELFRHASVRQRPPSVDEQAIRDSLQTQWETLTRQNKRKRRAWMWGIAASMALALAVGILMRSQSNPAHVLEFVAVASTVVGEVSTGLGADPAARLAGKGERLSVGQVLQTKAGSGLGLTWNSGTSLKLDERTEVRLVSRQEVFLASGRIYLDSPPGGANDQAISISTPQGWVRHVGTQFMTEVSAAGLTISVREGEVVYLSTPNDTADQASIGVGQQVSITDSGEIAVKEIPTWGQDWVWTENLSGTFETDGRSLSGLLAWAGRETGRQVKYSSKKAQRLAESTLLRGQLELDPAQALSVISATSDLVARTRDGLIVVELQTVD